ncbi:MAG: hypothetical protein WBM00_07415, partial [Solirubrobacterales bacterium]
MTFAAELIADRGKAASGEEFFRSPAFLEAEEVTHSLRIAGDDDELLAPLIVRPIDGTDRSDAISPYGYPGFDAAGDVHIDLSDVDFAPTGLVSIFIRHTLGESPLSGASERNIVQIADPALPPKSRMSDRQQIRRNLRDGYELRLVPGPEATSAERTGFLVAYEETMRRAGAAERYFFAAAYFERALRSSRSWLALAHAPGGEIAAASLAVRSDGFI